MPLRRAALVHRAEAFLLEALTSGYSPIETEQALRIALDRWRTLNQNPVQLSEQRLRFAGSHDPAVTLIAARFTDFAPGETPQLTFSGSLGGLIALVEGEADLAGCHLWDEESDTYNVPFVRRLLPGRRVALLTLAHRRLGFVVAPTHSMEVTTLGGWLAPAYASSIASAARGHGSGSMHTCTSWGLRRSSYPVMSRKGIPTPKWRR